MLRIFQPRNWFGIMPCAAMTDCVLRIIFNGNTTVPAVYSWKKRVELFCKGFEHAAEEGTKQGVSVFWGWEFSHAGTDFLTYGLDKEWLLRHPDCHEMRFRDYSALVRGDGGFISQAHPFREDWYIDMIRLSPREVDAVGDGQRLPYRF